MLSKFRNYESKLFIFFKLIDEKIQNIIADMPYEEFFQNRALINSIVYKKLFGYCLTKNENPDWDWCMAAAAETGNAEMFKHFLSKGGTNYSGSKYLSFKNCHRNLIDHFEISVYYEDWSVDLYFVLDKGYIDIAEYILVHVPQKKKNLILYKNIEKKRNCNLLEKFFNKKLRLISK